MPPVSDFSHPKGDEEKSRKSPPSLSSTTTPQVYVFEEDLSDPGPFYGMFDGGDEDDEEVINRYLIQAPTPASTTSTSTTSSGNGSGSIPKASEIFQRVMKQLDVPENPSEHQELSLEKACAAGKPERKSSKVKKSASFSTSAGRPSSSSSSSSSSSPSNNSSSSGPEVKRRMSMPCASKHVQWADEAGVSKLVSVRLIRPRLAKSDKEDVRVPAPTRSILRRLTGMR